MLHCNCVVGIKPSACAYSHVTQHFHIISSYTPLCSIIPLWTCGNIGTHKRISELAFLWIYLENCVFIVVITDFMTVICMLSLGVCFDDECLFLTASVRDLSWMDWINMVL